MIRTLYHICLYILLSTAGYRQDDFLALARRDW